MLDRRRLLAGAGASAMAPGVGRAAAFASRRPPPSARRFRSVAVEAAIAEVQRRVRDPKTAWLFANCFPNTLDTTVSLSGSHAAPDTFVQTGDIAAMWLRDSSAQVYGYLPFAKSDAPLRRLIAGVIRRQAQCILIDPYANAFMRDPEAPTDLSWAKADRTEMRPGVAERKWELDGVCHVVRLSCGYWRATGDSSPFDPMWRRAMQAVVATLRAQQRLHDAGPYRFERESETPLDTLMLSGLGPPTRKVGLVHSMFRPSDDACTLPFHVPANLFAARSLRRLAALWRALGIGDGLGAEAETLAQEIERAVQHYGRMRLADGREVWAYEVDGYGGAIFMDDANLPSLLSLPWLGACEPGDPLYLATRQAVLSRADPYFFKGAKAEGVGGPHVGMNQIWPLAIMARALTSGNDGEIAQALQMLKTTHAATGFMHESFDADDDRRFTRPWFAWANTLYGELILKVLAERPHLLT